ncbi:MAG TPA: hypothetical protein VMT20_16505 [Terriglobia bacterium]|nr:hypothetical protein [Terriglobia bacterium]
MKRKVAAPQRSRQPKTKNDNLLIEVGRTIGTALGAAAVRAERAREEAQKAVSAAGAELKQKAARATARLKRKVEATATPQPATRKKARTSAPRRKKVGSRSRKTS